MIVRRRKEILETFRDVVAENGNWRSLRLLLRADGMGFSMHDTTIYAGTRTLIHYKHHVEAVYCIEGCGAVELLESGELISLSAGTMYALNRHEKHYLIAESDLRIICIFNPPLSGDEDHDADGVYATPLNKKLTFAYLNLMGHPRGNHMLDCLVRAGFEPVAVIEEDSTLATKGRENMVAELEKVSRPLPAQLAEIIDPEQTNCYSVSNHNDATSVEILRQLQPDLIVLGDTRIIRSEVMELAPLGVVNVHPGWLPTVKGNNPYLWSIMHDLPQGCTVHFIDAGVDTGPILLRRQLHVRRGTTYPELLCEINRVCGEILVEAMYALRGGSTRGVPQSCYPNPTTDLPTFRLAPPEVKAEAIRRLEQGEYLCLDDRT